MVVMKLEPVHAQESGQSACARILPLLTAERLSEDEQRRVDEHLLSCEICQDALAWFGEMHDTELVEDCCSDEPYAVKQITP